MRLFLAFFEQQLDVNEDITTSTIHDQIKQIRQEHILFYQNAQTDVERQKFLKQIKKSLQKISKSIARAILDLERNVENTFKTEPNYKNKLVKLDVQKGILGNIEQLIEQSHQLITNDEELFFATATDEDLRIIIHQLKISQSEARQNIIELRRQVIAYINQTKHQTQFTEHLRKLKYLRDEHEIKHSTNVLAVLQTSHDLIFEPRTNAAIKLSLQELYNDDTIDVIKKINAQKNIVTIKAKHIADAIIEAQENNEEHIFIDHHELKRKFDLSNVHLFQFLQQYPFSKPINFEELVTLYCQMIILFEQDMIIEEKYITHQAISYALVYPTTFRQ